MREFDQVNLESHSDVKFTVVTANCYWWKLFDKDHGQNGRLGKKLAANKPIGLIGFQETEDVHRVLRDGGLTSHHQGQQFGNALAIAWDNNLFHAHHENGKEQIGEDKPGLWGKRYMAWRRFQHRATGQEIWFGVLHGPLPFETGGAWGNHATAKKIIDVKNATSKPGDLTIITGDFNSNYGAVL